MSKPLGALRVAGDVSTTGGTGLSLVKGVQVTLQAIALSVKPGGVVDRLEIGGALKTSGDDVVTLELAGEVHECEIRGGVEATGAGSDAAHLAVDAPDLDGIEFTAAHGELVRHILARLGTAPRTAWQWPGNRARPVSRAGTARTLTGMTQSLATYIALPGQTAEAFRHWHEVLGGESSILTYGEVPMGEMPFTPDPNAVAHATLDTPAGSLAGGDAMPGDETYNVRGSAYSLLYTVDSAERGREIIAKFVEAGGEATMPFEKAPWGQWYGQVFDKFGVMWALSVSPEGS